MEGIKLFFSEIDGRIFEINFSNLSNSDYLFNTKPNGFHLQSWSFVLCFFLILLFSLALIFLKKRRNKFYIEKGRRHILSFHTKLNLVLVGIDLILIFFRSQGAQYLSMRFLVVLFSSLILINSIVAIGRAIAHKAEDEIADETKTDDTYQKYLPKKKKKK